MKIGNNLRDLVLRQIDTKAITNKSCIYLGEKYNYKPITKREIEVAIEKIKYLLNIDKELKKVSRK